MIRRSSNQELKNKYERFLLAEKRLEHDLDIKTYLRTTSKVQGIVHSLLDDKQRMMLKYQNGRMISSNFKNKIFKTMLSDSKQVSLMLKERLNVNDLSPVDLRFLKGLT